MRLCAAHIDDRAPQLAATVTLDARVSWPAWAPDAYSLPATVSDGEGGHCTGLGVVRDGQLAVAATTEGLLFAFDTVSQDVVRVFTGHDGAVADLAVCGGGPMMVTAGADDLTLRLWDMCYHTLGCERVITLDVAAVCIAPSPVEKILAAGLGTGEVIVLDLKVFKVIRRVPGGLSGVRAMRFAPSGHWLAAAGHEAATGVAVLSMHRKTVRGLRRRPTSCPGHVASALRVCGP